jgi:hypothetical protein
MSPPYVTNLHPPCRSAHVVWCLAKLLIRTARSRRRSSSSLVLASVAVRVALRACKVQVPPLLGGRVNDASEALADLGLILRLDENYGSMTRCRWAASSSKTRGRASPRAAARSRVVAKGRTISVPSFGSSIQPRRLSTGVLARRSVDRLFEQPRHTRGSVHVSSGAGHLQGQRCVRNAGRWDRGSEADPP